MTTGWIERRTPGCGSELAHGPHAADKTYNRDGTVLATHPDERYCAGWTPGEADACVMLDQVHQVMLTASPNGTGAGLRLEVHPSVALVLAGLLLPGHAAQIRDMTILASTSLPPGAWRLIRPGPELAAGTVR